MTSIDSVLESYTRPFSLLSRMRIRLGELFTFIVIRRAKIATEWLIRKTEPDGTTTFFDDRRFPWIRRIESEWASIRAELDELLTAPESVPKFSDLSPMQAQMVRGRAWRSFFFHVAGDRHEQNAVLCPNTVRLVETIPGLQTAFFSILEPGTHLSPHRGPFGGVLRYHLALKVPEPPGACGIRVGKDVAHWEEGRSLVFDDSHDHEAWNDSDQTRVVLFVDFERPLRAPLRYLNQAMLWLVARAAFLSEIRANLRGRNQTRAV